MARGVLKLLFITLAAVATLNAAEFTHSELRAELLATAKADQEIRKQLIANGMKEPDPDALSKMIAADRNNLARLKQIIAEHGWPTRKMIGTDGVQAAFIILQHANRDTAFQKRMLPELKKSHRAGDIRGNHLALLTDRILVGEGKPQLYGTQASMVGGQPVFNEIADPGNLDKRRASLGLQPHASYREVMLRVYELNTAKEGADKQRKKKRSYTR